MRFSVVIFCIAFIGSGAYAQTNAELATSAEQAFSSGDYMKAVENSEACINKDSTNAECMIVLANAAVKLGDFALAKKSFHALEELDSTYLGSYIHLASIYEQQQRIPRATKYYNILNKMVPDNPVYFRKNAKLYGSIGDKQEAFRLYAKANKLNPKDALTLKGLAEICLANNQVQMADSLIRKGIDVDRENISLYYLLSRSKYKQKQYDSVTVILESIQGMVDLNSYYNKLLGYSYLQIDSVDLAIHKLQLALVDEEESEKLHYYLASAFEKKENEEGAMYHFAKAVEFGKSPDLDLYHRNLARLANNAKDYKTALAHYKDAYKYGKDPVVLYYLATISDIYYKDKSIAMNYYKKYMKSGHAHEAYQEYASSRLQYLKEQKHQSQ